MGDLIGQVGATKLLHGIGLIVRAELEGDVEEVPLVIQQDVTASAQENRTYIIGIMMRLWGPSYHVVRLFRVGTGDSGPIWDHLVGFDPLSLNKDEEPANGFPPMTRVEMGPLQISTLGKIWRRLSPSMDKWLEEVQEGPYSYSSDIQEIAIHPARKFIALALLEPIPFASKGYCW